MTDNELLDQIIAVMNEFGGHVRYRDLYAQLMDPSETDSEAVRQHKARIRATIEYYSSDSKVHRKDSEVRRDIFYSVDGIGNGHWGLRDYEATDKTVDLTEDDIGFPEGKKLLRTHIVRERNPRLTAKAKELAKSKHGKLCCEACGFSFHEKYGKLGEDFIEAHHLKPVSKLQDNEVTKVEDIALLCSNCHRMVHRYTPWIEQREKLPRILI
ncbi:HNH endonuclease [Paenibacillus sp. MMS20-IR301]|uniref:HNH endonuclease n=1 Tax=Paenibacillus sp. MMS20-IR301 TaxID=2895946 RepID=UPI0028EE297A|nr:HNH endonuclease [Paenibacillus sp. MMS20-IR301]WNS44034.1 HNH endonuclease [Paenibacillus sp. MMS20-IR301]